MRRWWDPRLTTEAASFSGATIELDIGGAVTLQRGDESVPIGTVTGYDLGTMAGPGFLAVA